MSMVPVSASGTSVTFETKERIMLGRAANWFRSSRMGFTVIHAAGQRFDPEKDEEVEENAPRWEKWREEISSLVIFP